MKAMLLCLFVLVSGCGSDDDSLNNGSNNGGNNGAPSGSCFHNCVAPNPITGGQIENFGCIAPPSSSECGAEAQSQCDGLGWGTAAASEYSAGCDSCTEACAPSFYDCSVSGCVTQTR